MSFLNYLASRWDHLLELAIAHAQVVFISLFIATAIGVTTGVLVYRRERTAEVVLAVTSTFLTIPSFALFGLLLPVFGLGWLPTIFALVVYALLPIVRNTIVGSRVGRGHLPGDLAYRQRGGPQPGARGGARHHRIGTALRRVLCGARETYYFAGFA